MVTRDKLKKLPKDFVYEDDTIVDGSDDANFDGNHNLPDKEKDVNGQMIQLSSSEESEDDDVIPRRGRRLRGNPLLPDRYGSLVSHMLALL